MNDKIRVAVVGANGAFGMKHLDGLANIHDAEVTVVSATSQEKADAVAAQYGVAHAVVGLDAVLRRDDVEAVILATPTGLHAAQTQAVLAAGKHVQVEIPLADSLADAETTLAVADASDRVAMVGHTRRFNPSHQFVHERIRSGEFAVQQLDVQTYFFRRTNTNARGEKRSWTDHLLWHHAAHTVDLFAYQSGRIVDAHAMQGPIHPVLGIAMDLSIQLKSETGAICTLSLSFNNEGPFGTFFRYIGDTATYVARYDDLFTGAEEQIDVSTVAVSMNGIELQDREFVAAIRDGREPNSSLRQVIDCYRVLGALEAQLA
ncbi:MULTISPECIES: Gfo/Idh/MocA family oxidoreductase [unclassified Microbacterium]|uniref:Gfo/Idh/MocA family oxidoreductase n=1 Tax=unclassified Microbacterium TaxID=2609290 RepID=UPI00313A1BF6